MGIMALRAVVESAVRIESGRYYHEGRFVAFGADPLLFGAASEVRDHVLDCEIAAFGVWPIVHGAPSFHRCWRDHLAI